ncbi:hypothetical protein [Clostridium sp.]|uniref:hypothetical protein n=1 Tax=Clostridium sp. TaxID=1506 RepID=UPI003216D4AD
MKDTMIQFLINKENEIIRSYESYLANVPIQEIDNRAQNSIVRHNNHIKVLKSIIRFHGKEKEKKLRSNYLSRKEDNLKKIYLNIMNNFSDGTLKGELYEIFKDEVDIINSNNLI